MTPIPQADSKSTQTQKLYNAVLALAPPLALVVASYFVYNSIPESGWDWDTILTFFRYEAAAFCGLCSIITGYLPFGAAVAHCYVCITAGRNHAGVLLRANSRCHLKKQVFTYIPTTIILGQLTFAFGHFRHFGDREWVVFALMYICLTPVSLILIFLDFRDTIRELHTSHEHELEELDVDDGDFVSKRQ